MYGFNYGYRCFLLHDVLFVVFCVQVCFLAKKPHLQHALIKLSLGYLILNAYNVISMCCHEP